MLLFIGLLVLCQIDAVIRADEFPLSVEGVCHDRTHFMRRDTFNKHSCTMCFFYLFKNTKALMFASIDQHVFLMPKNSSYKIEGPLIPNPANQTLMNKICSVLTKSECSRWTSCCNEAVRCCDQQLKGPPEVATGYCPRTWDGFSCWSDTKAGQVAHQECPTYMEHSTPTRHSKKECTVNSTWQTRKGISWTNYTSCVDREGYLIGVYIALGCNALSIAFLVPAIVIFAVFRELYKQHRVRIHINLFVSLCLSCIFNILWYKLIHHDLLVSDDNTNTVRYQNPVWCRILSFFNKYLISTTYLWMFCEGYYLHRLISNAFQPPKTLLWLYIVGWVVPAVPNIIYSIVKGVMDNTSCWSRSFRAYEWIIYGPNLICLVTNLIFLCNILRILLFQLHSHPHEPSNYRRGLKAAFMLIPLFGLQLFLTVYRPTPDAPGSREYEIIVFVVNSTQGIVVSLIFCYFNGEVHNQLRKGSPCCRRFCGERNRRHRNRGHSTQLTQITLVEVRKSPATSNKSLTSIKDNNKNGLHQNPTGDTNNKTKIGVISNGVRGSCQGNSKDGYIQVPTSSDNQRDL